MQYSYILSGASNPNKSIPVYNTSPTNVINLITKELDSLESIYMVSHKEIPIGYDTQLVITKNKKGLSSVKTY